MRRFIFALGASLSMASLLAISAATPALAKTTGPGGKQSPAPSWGQSYSYLYVAPNRPSWCLSEDDQHTRTWSGSLNGSFSATEDLCSTSTDYYNGMYWNAGGIGVSVDLYFTGTLSAASITSPTGGSHAAVLVGSTTSKGVTTYHYQACYAPPYSVSSDTGGAPLDGGNWSFSLSGNVANVSYTIDSEMAYVSWQQSSCPSSQQNLVS